MCLFFEVSWFIVRGGGALVIFLVVGACLPVGVPCYLLCGLCVLLCFGGLFVVLLSGRFRAWLLFLGRRGGVFDELAFFSSG